MSFAFSGETGRVGFPTELRGGHQLAQCSLSRGVWSVCTAPCLPSHPSILTIRSGGGVLRMKHLIWPFSPWRACWVWVLEMMGGPVRETASQIRDGQVLAGPLLGGFRSLFISSVIRQTFMKDLHV